ncbi:MAG: hypothetical protein ACXWJW_08950 [Xanthobacteraceae bacterium]
MHIGKFAAISAVAAALWVTPVLAQFNPATPVTPSLPPPPIPPQAVPGMNPQPAPVTRNSESNPLASIPQIRLGSPAAETHNDRSIRCVNQGGALGVPSGAMGRYVQECVNAP